MFEAKSKIIKLFTKGKQILIVIVQSLKVREIFTTNNKKTIEVELQTSKGSVRSSVPIGTSVGKYEAVYLPVSVAVRKFAMLRRELRTQRFESISEVDAYLRLRDGTKNFSEIGGNVALAISSAFLKAFALEEGMEVFSYVAEVAGTKLRMPRPLSIVAGWRKGGIQEYLLVPVHQSSFRDSVEKISQAYKELGTRLAKADPSFTYGRNLESGWITGLHGVRLLKLLEQVANMHLLKIGIDVAASSLWDGERYVYSYADGMEKLDKREQLGFMEDLAKHFPIIYVEDPFHEDDFTYFSLLTHRLSPKLVCGDDLYATNVYRLQEGLRQKASNAVLIKPNQVGTITDTVRVVREAQKHKLAVVVSHRSGETEDTLICHLAVGFGADYVKFGIAGERATKINELLRIEEKLECEF